MVLGAAKFFVELNPGVTVIDIVVAVVVLVTRTFLIPVGAFILLESREIVMDARDVEDMIEARAGSTFELRDVRGIDMKKR